MYPDHGQLCFPPVSRHDGLLYRGMMPFSRDAKSDSLLHAILTSNVDCAGPKSHGFWSWRQLQLIPCDIWQCWSFRTFHFGDYKGSRVIEISSADILGMTLSLWIKRPEMLSGESYICLHQAHQSPSERCYPTLKRITQVWWTGRAHSCHLQDAVWVTALQWIEMVGEVPAMLARQGIPPFPCWCMYLDVPSWC